MGHCLEFWNPSSSRRACVSHFRGPSSLMHATSQSLARIANVTLQSIMPSRTTLYQQVPNVRSSELLYTTLLRVLGGIEGVHATAEPSDSVPAKILSVLVTAVEITWSRSARRKKTSRSLQQTSQRSIIIQCRISCMNDPHPVGEKQQVKGLHLVYQWADGSDRGVFESFVSHVNRKVTAMEQGS